MDQDVTRLENLLKQGQKIEFELQNMKQNQRVKLVLFLEAQRRVYLSKTKSSFSVDDAILLNRYCSYRKPGQLLDLPSP